MCEHHLHSMVKHGMMPHVLSQRQHGAEAGFGMAQGRSLCCMQHLLAQRGTVCCYTPSDLALTAHPAGFADHMLQDKLTQQGWCSRFGGFWLCSRVRPSHRGQLRTYTTTAAPWGRLHLHRVRNAASSRSVLLRENCCNL